MDERYSPKRIEPKWQERWRQTRLYEMPDDVPGKENYYQLVEFSYPSGNLHVGHWYAYCGPDIHARYVRMTGKNVLFPIGFDAFGLPAENAAIKRGLNPRVWTEDNMARMRTQIDSMGASFDRSREVVTCHPDYYRWTQWLFIRLYDAGLVEQRTTSANWCPSCKTVLANEQVKDGKCERCGSEIVQREMPQWQMRITEYADRLVDDLDDLDWAPEIKLAQKNWIGRSEGTIVRFEIADCRLKNGKSEIENHASAMLGVFTTRVDTIFGCTYVVIAPEHELLRNPDIEIRNLKEVENYLEATKKKSDLERTELNKEKTGVKLDGIEAVNPFNGEYVPIYVADYVLGSYGTGAVMAVPAHDERDFEFAKKYGLSVKHVVLISDEDRQVWSDYHGEDLVYWNPEITVNDLTWWWKEDYCHTKDGLLFHSGEFSGLMSVEAREKMTAWLEEQGLGGKKTQYKLRDWTISRQRYWGVPIPLVHCANCGWQAVPDDDLPVELPEIDDYLPREDGRSPLAKAGEWVKAACPSCGGEAERETDTMDTFVDSSWYFLRYADPKNDRAFASKGKLEAWMPVDFYSGGAEHVTMHLLYARFFHKAIFDLGLVPGSEPFVLRRNRGLILGPDGNKMSKSKGNVIDPDEIVADLGADTMRLYLAFIGPYNEVGNYPWNPAGVTGTRRFLDRVWKLQERLAGHPMNQGASRSTDTKLEVLVHKTVMNVTESLEDFKLNTGVSNLMTLVNAMEKEPELPASSFRTLLTLLAPFAPHIAEELWSRLGNERSIFLEAWPSYDPATVAGDERMIVVQVNGKVRDQLIVPADMDESDLEALALRSEKVRRHTGGKEPKKAIVVPGKLINIVL